MMYRCPGVGFYFCSLIKKTRTFEKSADWNAKTRSAQRSREPREKPANEVMPSRQDMSAADICGTTIEL